MARTKEILPERLWQGQKVTAEVLESFSAETAATAATAASKKTGALAIFEYNCNEGRAEAEVTRAVAKLNADFLVNADAAA
jgi:hypothetical protein